MVRRSTVFSLSPEAFRIIARNLSNFDLFTISTCSKRAFNLVQKQNTLCPEKTPYNLRITMTSNHFYVAVHIRETPIISWYFPEKRNPERYWIEIEGEPMRSVKIHYGHGNDNEKAIGFRRISGGGYYAIAANSVQDFLHFVEHIGHLYNAPAKKVSIDPRFSSYLKAILSIPIFKNCSEFSMKKGTISHDALRQVLRFNGTRVTLKCNIDRNINFTLPLVYNCESISWNTTQVTNSHVNEFLHQWVRSKVQKPVDLEIKTTVIRKKDEKIGFYDDKCWMEPGNPTTREEKWDFRKFAEGLSRYVITYRKRKRMLVLRRETDGMQLRLRLFLNRFESRLFICDTRNLYNR